MYSSRRFHSSSLILFFILIFFYPVLGQTGSIYEENISGSYINKSVIGYGLTDRNDAVGSIVHLDSSMFNKGMLISPLKLITGKVPGMMISTNSGRPGSDFTITNRGATSFCTNSAPLIVVDNMIIMDNQPDLNPNDIESFTVLKGPFAVAVYGEKAANGAIIISTKKGSKKLKVSYSSKFGFSTLPKKVNVLSAGGFRDLFNKYFADSINIIAHPGNSDTDWQNEIYRTASGQDHHLSISGTLKEVPYRISLGHTNQEGVLKTSLYSRTSASITAIPVFFADHLKISINANGIFNNNSVANENAITNAVIYDPTQPVFNNSNFGGYYTWLYESGEPNTIATANPVALLEQTHDKVKSNRIIGNIKLDYSLHFFPDIRIVLNYGVDNYNIKDRTNVDTNASWTYFYGGGIIENLDKTYKNQESDLFIDYSKNFKAGSDRFNLVVGYSTFHQSVTTDHYKSNSVTPINVMYDSYSNINMEQRSTFARFSYSKSYRYFFNFAFRQEGESRYVEKNQNKLSFVSTFKWNIKNEAFLKSYTSLSDLIFQLNFGSTGAYWPFSVSSNYSVDPHLKHEKITSFNAGIDYGLFKNRIHGFVDFYLKTGNDLIMNIYIPSGSNFSNYILSNIGKLRNSGIELMVNAKVISTRNWFWQVNFNGSYNKNKIISMENYNPGFVGYLNEFPYNSVINRIQIQSPGYPLNSFYMLQQVYDQEGQPAEGIYVDRDMSGISGDLGDKYHYKQADPNFIAGLSSILCFKNLDFSFSGRLSLGNYLYNYMNSQGYYQGMYFRYTYYLRNISYSVNDTRFFNPQYYSDYYVEDASFFRMDYMSLGYSFKNVWNNKLRIHMAVTVQNAFIITNYKGQDPEVMNGIDYYTYPRARTFSLELKIDY